MSHQAIFLKQPKRAAALANAASKTAERVGVPALAAEASLMKAHAQALQQRQADCVESLRAAELLVRQAGREGDPLFIRYLDEAYVAAIAGHCFRALGDGERAEQSALRSLNMDNSYLRGRLFNQLLLASSYVLKADIEQACAVGMRALDIAEDVSSARALVFTTRLVDDLRPWRSKREVKDLTERARLLSL
jgi:hypothetical protein